MQAIKNITFMYYNCEISYFNHSLITFKIQYYLDLQVTNVNVI